LSDRENRVFFVENVGKLRMMNEMLIFGFKGELVMNFRVKNKSRRKKMDILYYLLTMKIY
jgi:hypothetical protein